MRELAATGFLSNRMRQIVASHWVYAMNGNWQVGAAWFESCLIDYDVYSNQGNWLYVAGHGTDPRGGRAFNVAKQIAQYDADGSYRKRWLD
jgi:deoxyribodipyrimidine photo-lyase